EAGHLAPGDIVAGTEAVVGGWVAPAGDSGRRQGVDLGLEDRVVVVCEAVAVGGDVPVRPGEERRHLASGDAAVRAEPVVRRRVAAFGDAGGGEGVDVA